MSTWPYPESNSTATKLCRVCARPIPKEAKRCGNDNCGAYQGLSHFFDASAIITTFLTALITIITGLIALSQTTGRNSDAREMLSMLREGDTRNGKLQQQVTELTTSMSESKKDLEEITKHIKTLETDEQKRVYRLSQLRDNGWYVVRSELKEDEGVLKTLVSSKALKVVAVGEPINFELIHSTKGAPDDPQRKIPLVTSYKRWSFQIVESKVHAKDVVGFHVVADGTIRDLNIRPGEGSRFDVEVRPVHHESKYTSQTKNYTGQLRIEAYVLDLAP